MLSVMCWDGALQLGLWHSLAEADWAIGHPPHHHKILRVARHDLSPILPKGASHGLGIQAQGR
jgi:hypothetical protein